MPITLDARTPGKGLSVSGYVIYSKDLCMDRNSARHSLRKSRRLLRAFYPVGLHQPPRDANNKAATLTPWRLLHLNLTNQKRACTVAVLAWIRSTADSLFLCFDESLFCSSVWTATFSIRYGWHHHHLLMNKQLGRMWRCYLEPDEILIWWAFLQKEEPDLLSIFITHFCS